MRAHVHGMLQEAARPQNQTKPAPLPCPKCRRWGAAASAKARRAAASQRVERHLTGLPRRRSVGSAYICAITERSGAVRQTLHLLTRYCKETELCLVQRTTLHLLPG